MSEPILILKLALLGTSSVRTVALPGDLPLGTFEDLAIDLFGFDGSHQLDISSSTIPQAPVEDLMDDEAMNRRAKRIGALRLDEAFPVRGAKAKLEYDFGDGWEIGISRLADKKTAAPFTCLKTVGMDAMDDCGGPGGLAQIVAGLKLVAANKPIKDSYLKETLAWVIGDKPLTPASAAAFLSGPDAAAITARLAKHQRV